MKNIKNFLTEAKDITFEPSPREYKWSPNAKFMYIHGYDHVYQFWTEEDIKALNDYYEPADDDIATILALAPGECFSPDGGENNYIRIKK